MQVVTRPAAQDDIPALLPLLQDLFSIEEDFHFDPALQHRGLRLLLDTPAAEVVVAHHGTEIIGMVTGQLVISTAEGGLSLLLEDLVVMPQYRGKGVGKLLLQSIGDWAASKGAKRMQLLADRNNAAGLAFYASAGWKNTSLICLRKYTHEGEAE